MTWHVNFVRSKDVQKQLARTSLKSRSFPLSHWQTLMLGNHTQLTNVYWQDESHTMHAHVGWSLGKVDMLFERFTSFSLLLFYFSSHSWLVSNALKGKL